MRDCIDRDQHFDALIVWDDSRLARNVEETMRAFRLLAERGIELHMNGAMIPCTSAGRLNLAIKAVMSEHMIHRLSEDTDKAMVANFHEGGFNRGAVPKGYRLERPFGERGRAVLVPCPEWAPVIRRMFQLALAGNGGMKIAASLNAEGLRTRTGREWTNQTVLYILRNEVYKGVYIWRRRSTAKFVQNPEMLRREDNHEPLVSPAIFDRVRDLIHDRSPEKANPRAVASAYLVAGLVRCQSCGGPMIGHPAKSGRYHYYRCKAKTKRRALACAGRGTIPRSTLEGMVLAALRDHALRPPLFAELLAVLQEHARSRHGQVEDQRAGIQSQKNDKERRLRRLFELLEDGLMDVATLKPRIEAQQAELQALEQALRSLAAQPLPEIRTYTPEELRATLSRLHQVVKAGTVDERKALIRSWIRQVVVGDHVVEVTFCFPAADVRGPLDAGSLDGGGTGGEQRVRLVVNPPRASKKAAKSAKAELPGGEVLPSEEGGADNRTRTCDPAVNSRLLYQLSYVGTAPAH